MSAIPHSPDAEASVVGGLLAKPGEIGEVVGSMLEPDHFYLAPFRALFHELVSAYYADDPIDPLTIGELTAKTLSRSWGCDESEAVQRVVRLSRARREGNATDHARIVKRDFDYRELLALAESLHTQVASELNDPDEIAAEASQTAMQIATSTLLTKEITSFEDVGRNFVRTQRRLMAARAAGIELGAYFGLKFLDNWTRGLQPTEFFVLAGPPGSGKSAVAWKAAQQFAERQMNKPPHERVATLVLSLEMGEEPSSVRVAQTITGLDGGMLREGRTSEDDLARVIAEWAKRKEIPLHFAHNSVLRSSQLRAMVIEAIRRHNVGFVVVDHMRYVDMEGRFASKNEEDEEKARFFKQRIAKDLNVACMVLAHTTKAPEGRDDRRPRLADLRGSGQIAAEADFVAFVHQPYAHASQEDIDEGRVSRTDAELIFEKNRHGLTGIARFFADMSTMDVR